MTNLKANDSDIIDGNIQRGKKSRERTPGQC